VIAIAEKSRLPDPNPWAVVTREFKVTSAAGTSTTWMNDGLQVAELLTPRECGDARNFFHSPQYSREVLFITVCQFI
jgi:hypothetical protein